MFPVDIVETWGAMLKGVFTEATVGTLKYNILTLMTSLSIHIPYRYSFFVIRQN